MRMTASLSGTNEIFSHCITINNWILNETKLINKLSVSLLFLVLKKRILVVPYLHWEIVQQKVTVKEIAISITYYNYNKLNTTVKLYKYRSSRTMLLLHPFNQSLLLLPLPATFRLCCLLSWKMKPKWFNTKVLLRFQNTWQILPITIQWKLTVA